MTFRVEMYRGSYQDGTLEEYMLDVWTWRTLLDFAKTNGWSAQGTKPDPEQTSNPEYMKHFTSDYEPKDIALTKYFDGEDARQLAEALTNGLNRVHKGEIQAPKRSGTTFISDSMNREEIERMCRYYLDSIPEFAEYLQRGEFSFAWDD